MALDGEGRENNILATPAHSSISEQPVPKNINISMILEQLERATLWPARLMVRSSNRKILAGDIGAGGRLISTLAQIEAYLVLAQVLIPISVSIPFYYNFL